MKQRIIEAFNYWANNNTLPYYISKVKLIGLSKEGTNPKPK